MPTGGSEIELSAGTNENGQQKHSCSNGNFTATTMNFSARKQTYAYHEHYSRSLTIFIYLYNNRTKLYKINRTKNATMLHGANIINNIAEFRFRKYAVIRQVKPVVANMPLCSNLTIQLNKNSSQLYNNIQ
jgi:hypothetical protein